ncbi:MAG: ABC transporter substrate-binding protein [Thermus sp.]|nr:ABC transporter substrate-binding protein [Thermus sp.]
MRVVSLVPAGTALLRALGVEPVGVTHSCPNPHGVPVVTESLIPKGLPQEKIDQRVREARREGFPLYRIREEVLASLRPDVLVTQGVCEVCAVGPGEVASARTLLPLTPQVVELKGVCLDGLYSDIRALARAVGQEDRGALLVQQVETRLGLLPPPPPRRPTVAFLEWLEPPYLGGHWVPDMVALAGGRYLGPAPGEPSRRVEAQELPDAQVVFLAFCGHGLGEAWEALDAHLRRGGPLAPYLRSRRVYVLEAAFFQALTHLVAEGTWLLARALRGEEIPPALARRLEG